VRRLRDGQVLLVDRTAVSGNPIARATAARTRQGAWVVDQIVSPSPAGSGAATTVIGWIGTPASRLIPSRRRTRWAAPAKTASIRSGGVPLRAVKARLVPSRGWTSGASGRAAASTSETPAIVSQSTSIRARASAAWAGVWAITSAIGTPTWRAASRARIGCGAARKSGPPGAVWVDSRTAPAEGGALGAT
jgi:hypothetical protein